MGQVVYGLLFFLIFSFIGIDDLGATTVMGSMPVTELSNLGGLFSPAAVTSTHLLLLKLGSFLHTLTLPGWVLFSLSLLLYTFLILSVRLKRAYLSIAALSSFCLLAMYAFTIQNPSLYVAIFLCLSFLLLTFDLFFFGSRGWMTWVALLPMSWAWWIWLCTPELTQILEESHRCTLFHERGVWLLTAWIVSILVTRVDIRNLKNVISVSNKHRTKALLMQFRNKSCNGAKNLSMSKTLTP